MLGIEFFSTIFINSEMIMIVIIIMIMIMIMIIMIMGLIMGLLFIRLFPEE